MLKRLFLCALAASLLFVVRPVSAQSSGPVYIVQPDDTLYSIAARFNVSINFLMAANNITDANLLGVGQQLVIPGLQGVSGVLDTEYINFGDSFHSLLRRTQIPLDLIRRLNHVVSPTEFYVGASLIVPKQENQTDLKSRLSATPGESLFELAVQSDAKPLDVERIRTDSTAHGMHFPEMCSTRPVQRRPTKTPADSRLLSSARRSPPCPQARRHRRDHCSARRRNVTIRNAR